MNDLPIGSAFSPEGERFGVVFGKPFFEVFSHTGIGKTFGAFDNINKEFWHSLKQKTQPERLGSYLFVAGLGLEPRTSGL